MKEMRTNEIDCEKCGNKHSVDVDFSKLSESQKTGKEPVMNFICPDSAWMYRIFGFSFDTRVRILNDYDKDMHTDILSGLKNEWGALDFDDKIDRFKDLNLSLLGIPEEYSGLLWEVISSHCCGLYYPAMTSAGALGERIINRLILKIREHMKSSPHYKKVYRKASFDKWDDAITILNDWEVISDDVSDAFRRLKVYRNDSIHYNDGYDFEQNSRDAVSALGEIVKKQFSYQDRKDLFWVFDVPGEILLKSEKVNDAFVKEFVLPHCRLITTHCEPTTDPVIKAKNVLQKPFTDREFIEARRNRGL